MDAMHLNLTGDFAVEHWYRKERIDVCSFHNDTTNEGKNRFLDIEFHGVPQITYWYCGLIDYTGYTAVAATDTYANINLTNGWSEFTLYSDTTNGSSTTTRPLWSPDAALNQSIANSTQLIFTVTAPTAAYINGLFIVGGSSNAQIKGDHTASNSVLWSTALFGSTYHLFPSSIIRVIYTINA
ncbi:MAG: hypothetical protein M0R50_03175 [Candidatus Cloacimonetes bacterium]|jgi:hypothetical protein|nr:hypothetical protein [Candidatus Cloacimonadota bacterium]